MTDPEACQQLLMQLLPRKPVTAHEVNTPPPEGGGFGLRLKAGSVGLWADYCQLSRRRLPLFESNFADVSPPLSPLA